MNQFNESMDLKTILAKKPEELSDEEKDFVRQNEGELDADQKTAFASVIDDTPAETDEEKAAREEKEQGDANEAAGLNRDGSAKITASEKGKVITMSEAEAHKLREAADKGVKALEKIEASERAAKASKMIFSQSNQNGRFLPKQQSALEGFLATLSEKQQDQFVNLVSNMPKASLSFAEVGDGGKEVAATKAAEIEGLVKEKIKASEGKMKYSVALSEVMKEHPKLAAEYNAEIEGTTGND